MRFAKIERSSWQESLNTRKGFDYASRIEILVFAKLLEEQSRYLEKDYKDMFRSKKKIDFQSIKQWKKKTKNILVKNFQNASKSCRSLDKNFCTSNIGSWESLIILADTMPNQFLGNSNKSFIQLFDGSNKPLIELKAWYQQSSQFHRTYLYEQIRLAGLFSRVTSEILPFSKEEILGDRFSDLDFLLTFDDGPSGKRGNTDRLIQVLKKHQLNGYFFALGQNLEKRKKKTSKQKLRKLYDGMCLASHGYKHKSHARMKNWAQSIQETGVLIKEIVSERGYPFHFRPPYGQRKKNLSPFLTKRTGKVILWNIDSQDWHSKMSPQLVTDRVITLMLLWRKGILLFHDTHSKAKRALPNLISRLGSNSVRWMNCKDY